MVPDNNSIQVKIYILPGVYREEVMIPPSKPYVLFIGDPTRASDTNTVVAVSGGYKMQDVALRIACNKAVLFRVRILGAQDTLLDETGSHYFYRCRQISFVLHRHRSSTKKEDL
ncbi:hypothetical protein M8C21_000708 [Ambrosia artemisiifolia]|uniref:Pectinesterase n=1 Tax=Ambrosia artemisiifolia TaxID=4212 RepID=A0AAD5D4K2_AMBAR|nr:hypothetical protein M8C21_000708 [Ambrosia artemisiifolia]